MKINKSIKVTIEHRTKTDKGEDKGEDKESKHEVVIQNYAWSGIAVLLCILGLIILAWRVVPLYFAL